jgi:Sulfatase
MRIQSILSTTLVAVGCAIGWLSATDLSSVIFAQEDKTALAQPAKSTRLVLPVPDPQFKGKIGRTTAESESAFPMPVTAPTGAPNVLLIMTDDVGFGASSTFGGPIPTPSFDKLAARGVKYNRFHTTALCSPTRASLITGRNHHNAHTGIIMERSLGFPGYDSVMPKSCGTVAETLKQNGYNTAVRQEPQRTGLAVKRGRAVRPLAYRPGLRILLRLHRRRYEPVGTVGL